MKQYKDSSNNLFELEDNAIPAPHLTLIEKTKFDEIIAQKNQLTSEQILLINTSTVKDLKLEALNEIKILEYEDDTEILVLWETYYNALKAVDTSVEEMVLPKKPS